MQFSITKALPIKELVIRYSVSLDEIVGAQKIHHSVYDVAVDVQPYVTPEDTDDGVKLNIDYNAIMQELTAQIHNLQITNGVAQHTSTLIWNVVPEDEKRSNEELSD